MNTNFDNNQVTISGEIVSEFRYSHELYGEKFYLVDIKVQRLSENCDIIPVTVSERLMDISQDSVGLRITVNGHFRSYNVHEEYKNRLMLAVFATEISLNDSAECEQDANAITLVGYICKAPVYRRTPLGREIADVLLAVNRAYGKSDYIPCVMWGRNARFAGAMKTGQKCKFKGRIQSREYIKKLADETEEKRTAYEVSVSTLEVLADEK